jgi:hypothetical protein
MGKIAFSFDELEVVCGADAGGTVMFLTDKFAETSSAGGSDTRDAASKAFKWFARRRDMGELVIVRSSSVTELGKLMAEPAVVVVGALTS